MTKTQVAVAAVVGLTMAVLLVIQHQQKARVTDELQAARMQAEEVSVLKQENQRLSNLLVQASSANAAPAQTSGKEFDELQRLRGEVGVLRKTATEAAAAPKPSTESPLSGITQAPEMSKMLRDQQKRAFSVIYRDFGKQANLAPEKLEAFNSLLADDVMTNIDHITTLLRDGKSAEEIEQIFSSQEAELHTKVQALLGEEGLNQYKDYNQKLLSRLTAEQFKSMMQGDNAQKEAAAKQLSQAMQEETQKVLMQAGLRTDYQMVPTLNFRNFVSEQEGERNLQLMDAIYQQVQARSAAFLKPEEVEKFGEFRKRALDNNRLALTLNRKLMAPPGK
jgi:hypothetical protein